MLMLPVHNRPALHYRAAKTLLIAAIALGPAIVPLFT
ncbi:hypothetical protein GGQ98_001760 [Sphingosinicella soli]|uniref:Uncharacterized protein n=1 Tax=Sphingosinicella soli TaxID=333708 RepID=A0A7W7B161_9SPHN|nr:hypothetical protein [Sphingosinicella soli]